MKTLFLPGMDGTGRLFAPLLAQLPTTITPEVVSYATDRAQSYDELLATIPVPTTRFAIVAESFSGPLGIRLAAAHPDRVSHLVLVASFVRNPTPIAGWLLSTLGALVFRLEPPGFALRVGLLDHDAPPDVVAALREAIRAVSPVVMASRIRAIRALDVRDELAATTVPLLALAGSRDRLVGEGAMAEIKTLRPDAITCTLDAPHLVLQRRPAEAAAVIAEFLAR